ILIGGSMYLVLDAGDLVRVLIASLYQAAVLGVIVGFLATVEYVIYTQLRATVGDATPG
ncbi:MAG: hypothetical protein QOK47_143, partial [Actinomycetota bacterium]|nr:hypothetical protein [Actinomycetota bacterium]